MQKNQTVKRPLSSQKLSKSNNNLKGSARIVVDNNNANDQQINTFTDQAKRLNKKNSMINQNIIKSTVYNKKQSNGKSR